MAAPVPQTLNEEPAVRQEFLAKNETANGYEFLFLHNSDAVFACNLAGHFLRVNNACQTLLGYTPNELMAMSFLPLVVPEDKDYAAEHLHIAAQGLPEMFEVTLTHKDGQPIFVSLTVLPLIQEELTLGIYGIAKDISARKQGEAALQGSEQRLRQSEERLRLALESGCLGTFDLDLTTGKYLDLSPIWRTQYGIPQDKEEVSADEWLHIIHPDDRERTHQASQQAIEDHQDYKAEYRIVRPDGTVHWSSVHGTPLYGESGQPLRLVGVTQEITQRKRQELEQAEARQREEALARQVAQRAEALLRQSQHTQLLLEAAGEGFFGIDIAGNNTFVNPAAAEMLGYFAEELLGQPMHATLHYARADGSPYPREECPIYAAFTDGVIHRITGEVFWRKDGTSFPVEYVSTPVREAEQITGAVVTFRDITERQTWEAAQRTLLAEAVERADHDPLTGLWNHRAFYRRLEEECARTERGGTRMAVVMLDLNHFGFFNNVYGHVVGDAVLHQVAELLLTVCRPYDTCARFGGDEFSLILSSVGHASTAEIETRLRSALSGLTFQPDEAETVIPITLSLGATVFSGDRQDCLEAVRTADERLRRAKTGGGSDTEADQVRLSALAQVADFSMLDALVTAVDNKDRYTRQHSEDVMACSLMIAREMGLAEDVLQTVAVAALLHDLGKIGVADAILRKPGKLTAAEFEAVKRHPQTGAVIVAAVPGLEGTLDAVRHHHERWDGGGYPAGLKGEETPLMARLMAVADAFSAMTADRPYRKGMEREQALSLLAEGSGSQWDPSCVTAFLSAIRQAETLFSVADTP